MCLYFYKISLGDTLEQVSSHKAYNVSYLIPYRKSWLVSSLTTYHLSPGMRTRRKRIYYRLFSIWYLFYPQETKKRKMFNPMVYVTPHCVSWTLETLPALVLETSPQKTTHQHSAIWNSKRSHRPNSSVVISHVRNSRLKMEGPKMVVVLTVEEH